MAIIIYNFIGTRQSPLHLPFTSTLLLISMLNIQLHLLETELALLLYQQRMVQTKFRELFDHWSATLQAIKFPQSTCGHHWSCTIIFCIYMYVYVYTINWHSHWACVPYDVHGDV